MKILGRVVALLVIVEFTMFAMVEARLKDSVITAGERAVLMIEASGKSIKFPDIEEIEGYKIRGKSTNTNITYNGSKKSKSFIRKYIFYPQKTLTIPSYKVKIGDKNITTKPLKLIVKKDPLDSNGTIIFKQLANKSELYVGEGVIISYLFKHKLNLDIADAAFHSPKFEGFWAKKLKSLPNKSDIKDGYRVYEMRYILYPERSGLLKIDSAKMDIGIYRSKKRSYYTFRNIKRKVISSNSLKFNVKELPDGVEVFGDYSFSAVVDKNRTKINRPVNLTITITGEGNVDDIDEFHLDIDGAMVYSDKPKRFMELKDDKSIILFKQKFAIVSDKNFTIPPIEFRFFDANTKKIKTLRSKAKNIEVIGAKEGINHTVLQKSKNLKKEKRVVLKRGFSKSALFLVGLVGFLVGVLVTLLYKKRKRKSNKKRLDIKEKIRGTKDDKELLSLLLPYIDYSKKIQKVIHKLEENIYKDAKHKIDKKDIAASFDTLIEDDKEIEILK